jgi:hypothetical protein
MASLLQAVVEYEADSTLLSREGPLDLGPGACYEDGDVPLSCKQSRLEEQQQLPYLRTN